MNGWIGVDLDGTLAEYDQWEGPTTIGAPIPAMVDRVKRWLSEDREVRIFTARACPRPGEELREVLTAIEGWSREHIGQALPVTCVKDFGMEELWDDRAVSVEPNTGRALAPSRRGLDDPVGAFASGGVVGPVRTPIIQMHGCVITPERTEPLPEPPLRSAGHPGAGRVFRG